MFTHIVGIRRVNLTLNGKRKYGIRLLYEHGASCLHKMQGKEYIENSIVRDAYLRELREKRKEWRRMDDKT